MLTSILPEQKELIELTSQTTSFESEDMLIDIVIKEIHHLVNGIVVVSTELPVGGGVVDIIAGRVRQEPQNLLRYQTLSRTEAYVLSQLYYKQRLKLETIARRTELQISLVEEILISLCRGGYCISSGQCYLRAKPIVSNLIAIEGKIKNWKRALQQAIRNQLFCSQSFVALDAKYSKPAIQNITLFKKHRVGLVIVFRSGFGVYFAPCLRKGKQGKAESAAFVPTLWIDIDCDGDAHQRDEGLRKLRDFDPAPSFIFDSGGWHGYCLLDEPFQLQSDEHRQKIAGILCGLFSALGGDPEYVKTVAGIMRLPDSVNTKPERGGVAVTVVECQAALWTRLFMEIPFPP